MERVRAMARDSNRWKAVCTPSASNGTDKRLDYVQRRHATPPDCQVCYLLFCQQILHLSRICSVNIRFCQLPCKRSISSTDIFSGSHIHFMTVCCCALNSLLKYPSALYSLLVYTHTCRNTCSAWQQHVLSKRRFHAGLRESHYQRQRHSAVTLHSNWTKCRFLELCDVTKALHLAHGAVLKLILGCNKLNCFWLPQVIAFRFVWR